VLDAPFTTQDRYARAIESSRLVIDPDRLTDADVLLAAGWATQGDPSRMLALKLYRLQVGRYRDGLASALEEAERMLNGRLQRTGRKSGLPPSARRAIVVATVRHWLDAACPYCEGRGHNVIDGTKTLSSENCRACYGAGKTPLLHIVPRAHVEHAQWLEDELNRLLGLVFGELARRIAQDLAGIGP
jgi:hypothetical protein